MAADRLVPVRVAAEILGVSDETVYRRARAGQLAYLRDERTGTWRFSLASVEAYIRDRLVPARPAVVPVASSRRAPRAATASDGPTDLEPWRGSLLGGPSPRARRRKGDGPCVAPIAEAAEGGASPPATSVPRSTTARRPSAARRLATVPPTKAALGRR